MSGALVDLRPGHLDVRHRRGDPATFQLTIKEGGIAVNITGRTYRGQLRRKPAATVSAEVTVTFTDAAHGVMAVVLLEDISLSLSGAYAWDFEQIIAGQRRTILAGTWTVDDDVTRNDP
jgi:hypothetical protein